MTERVRPYLYYDAAVSICSTCYRKVEGKIVLKDDGVSLLHLLQFPMTWLSGGISVFLIGVTQLLYVLPVLVVLVVKKQSEAAKGLCTAAGIFLAQRNVLGDCLWVVERLVRVRLGVEPSVFLSNSLLKARIQNAG